MAGFRLGDRAGSSADLIDDGCEALGEDVFSDALVMIDEFDMAELEAVQRRGVV